MPPTTRRTILLAGALAAPALTHSAKAATVLNVVLESEAVILDPYFTTAAITRSFGYHVFDTLFAMDSAGAIRPQMVDSFTATEDGLLWRFTLRQGLRFHNGAAVTARDCAVSLQRWAPRDAMGRLLLAVGAQFEAADARTLVLRLRDPFPLVLDVLGKPNAPVSFILPERLARTPGETASPRSSAADPSPSAPISGDPATAWCWRNSSAMSHDPNRRISSLAARW